MEDRIDSFQKLHRILQTCVGDAIHEGNRKAPKPIRMHIKPLVRQAVSVYHSYLKDLITLGEAIDKLRKLLNLFKLLKMELLLEGKPLDIDSSSIVTVKTVNEGLTLLRTFLLGPLDENGKMILNSAESLAECVASVYCYLYADKSTVEMTRISSHLLSNLVQDVKSSTAEIKEVYLQVRSSSQANVPKTRGSGFIDSLLVNMTELLNSDANSICLVRHQIQVVLGEFEFLGSFYGDTKQQYKQHSDLENIVSCCLLVVLRWNISLIHLWLEMLLVLVKKLIK